MNDTNTSKISLLGGIALCMILLCMPVTSTPLADVPFIVIREINAVPGGISVEIENNGTAHAYKVNLSIKIVSRLRQKVYVHITWSGFNLSVNDTRIFKTSEEREIFGLALIDITVDTEAKNASTTDWKGKGLLIGYGVILL